LKDTICQNSTKIDYLSRIICIKEIESIALQNKEHQPQIVSMMNSTKHLRKKLHQFSTAYNLFRKVEAKQEVFPNSFYEASITLIPKAEK